MILKLTKTVGAEETAQEYHERINREAAAKQAGDATDWAAVAAEMDKNAKERAAAQAPKPATAPAPAPAPVPAPTPAPAPPPAPAEASGDDPGIGHFFLVVGLGIGTGYALYRALKGRK